MVTQRASSPPLPFTGRVLGGYRIARAIASGGMATVFLARKTGPGRYAQTAAIKVIHPHLAHNRELTEMFLDEARLASSVNHPNVCRVLDFGEAEGTFYLAMEYVRGESLASVLPALADHGEARARRLTLGAHVIAQACEGLHAIHEAVDGEGRALHIVHRDVSPQNLLIAYDGSVRLLDFGIASAEGRAHTGSGDVVRGRYAYMAPEQMRGLEVDRRADVWSLGVMLREALTCHNPYLQETQIATMLAVTQEEPKAFPSGVEPRLRAICELCLARAPEERFASARELGDALTRYLSERGESALSTELSQWMRQLFAREIAEKRAALRELAGDDSYTDTFSAGYPAVRVSAEPAPSAAPAKETVRPRRRRPPALAAAVGAALLSLALLSGWFLTTRSSGARDGIAAAPARPAAAGGLGTTPLARAPRAEPPALARAAPRAEGRNTAEIVDGPSAAEHESADAPEPETAAGPAEAAPHPARGTASALRGVEARASAREQNVEARASAREQNVEARASAREQNEAKQRGSGTLAIGTSQGWATIFDRGKKLGNTPLRVQLGQGPHTLVVRPYGADAARRIHVDVRPGETIKLHIEL